MGKTVRRLVDTSFWEDAKVIDRFSTEDKYFMLYLLTNPHTSQAGIYRLPYRLASFETGFTPEVVKVILDRFETKYHMIVYSKETQEVAILNSLKYSIVKGGKPVSDCIISDLESVENPDLILAVYNNLAEWWDQSRRAIDHTVKDIFYKELIKRKVPKENIYDNDNDNDNDNEESYHDSCNDSSNESSDSSIDDSQNADTKGSNKKKKSSNKPTIQQITEEFEFIWDKYPKKKGKKAAFNHYKAWRKADPILNTPKYLIKRLNAYRKHLIKNRTPEQYVLNGSTWFNGRFDDVLDVDKIQAKHGGFDKRLFENKDVNTDDLPF